MGMLRRVRLRLRPPPRSSAQTEISRFSANSPELAAIRHAFCLCTLPIELQGPFRRSLSLPWKIAFPDGGEFTNPLQLLVINDDRNDSYLDHFVVLREVHLCRILRAYGLLQRHQNAPVIE